MLVEKWDAVNTNDNLATKIKMNYFQNCLITIDKEREAEIIDDKCNMRRFFDRGLDELKIEDLFM